MRKAASFVMLSLLTGCGSGCSDVIDVIDPPVASVILPQPKSLALEQQEIAVRTRLEVAYEELKVRSASFGEQLEAVGERLTTALKRTGEITVNLETFKTLITGRVDQHEERLKRLEDQVSKDGFVIADGGAKDGN